MWRVRVGHLIESGELVGRGATELARQMTEELKDALSDYSTDEVEHHIANMPRAWLLNQPGKRLSTSRG